MSSLLSMGEISSMMMKAMSTMLTWVLLVAFVPAYFVMRMREKELDKEARDHQLGLKSILLLFQVVCFQQVLYGIYLLFNWLFGMIGSQGITFLAARKGIGIAIGAAGLFIGLEILLAQTNNKDKWYPRKVFYGINLMFTLVFAVMGVTGFLGALLGWESGSAFHVPLTQMFIYAPAAAVLTILQINLFGGQSPKGALAGGLLGLGGSKLQNFSDQAGAGMAAASMAMDNAASPGVSPQQPQQPGGAPMSGGGSMPQSGAQQPQQTGGFGGAQQQSQAQQPQAQAQPSGGADPSSCPTCGGRTRFIAQYNRTWCDTCQRYL